MKHAAKLIAAALLMSTLTAPAQASVYTFNISGDYVASFRLRSSPTPNDAQNSSYFTVWDVSGFSDALVGLADVTFYNSVLGGGIGIEDYRVSRRLLVTDGPQLYSGSEAAPTFLTGTFALTQFNGSGRYTLTIRDEAVAAVPETVTWAMMLAGFGMIGFAARRSQSVKTTVRFT